MKDPVAGKLAALVGQTEAKRILYSAARFDAYFTGGTYTGRADNGSDSIDVPVEIYGGFSPDFSRRDPWGSSRTVFTGIHNAQNFVTTARLLINTSAFATRLMQARGEPTEHRVVVDGIIFDNGPRNHYAGDGAMIIRMGTPSDTPTPESGALVITTGVDSTVIVRHIIALNTAPTQGAIALFPEDFDRAERTAAE